MKSWYELQAENDRFYRRIRALETRIAEFEATLKQAVALLETEPFPSDSWDVAEQARALLKGGK